MEKVILPSQKQFDEFVAAKGGLPTVLASDELVEKIFRRFAGHLTISRDGENRELRKTDSGYSLKDFKGDLQENLDSAIKKNFDVFGQKFEMKLKSIADQERLIMLHLKELAEDHGPHDRVIDPVCCS